MTSKANNDLFSGALSLPAQDRARLAHELLCSLDESDSTATEAWLDEIDRRAREVRDGRVVLDDWADVRQRLHSRWSNR